MCCWNRSTRKSHTGNQLAKNSTLVVFCVKVCLNQQMRNVLKALCALLIVYMQLKELQVDAPSWTKMHRNQCSVLSFKMLLPVLKQTKSSHANHVKRSSCRWAGSTGVQRWVLKLWPTLRPGSVHWSIFSEQLPIYNQHDLVFNKVIYKTV